MKCSFCRKQADARVDIGGTLVPVCAKHFGNHDIKAIPNTNITQELTDTLVNIGENAGLEGGLD